MSTEPHTSETKAPPPVSLAGRFARLALALGILWILIYVLAPMPLQHVEVLQKLVDSNESRNIRPGALYYTDLPMSMEAEHNTRDAVRRAERR